MVYASLWCKSNYSFLEGASHPEELIRSGYEAGWGALALTDRDGLYGVVRAHVEAASLGFKLIIGSEITVEGGGTVVLLVRDGTGYRNLCSLITAGRLRSPKGESRVAWTEILSRSAGLTALVPGSGPAVKTAGRPPWENLRDSFRDFVYIGYAKHRTFEDARRARLVRNLSTKHGLPVAAAPEVLYHHSERRPLQDVLACISRRVPLEDAGAFLKPNHHYGLSSPQEFERLYADRPDAVRNTALIADSCSFRLDEIRYTYPTETLPEGHTVSSRLEDLVRRGVLKRYPGSVPAAVEKQIRRELRIIEELEYGGYFLTMEDIVRYCRENGILCQGRGSAANSIVCYCLGITAVDPVQMNLLFERFLSVERAEPPDIDLDIDHRRREEVIQHMYAKYGRDRAAMVANVVRYRPKSAVRDVGKALGFSSTKLERLTRSLSTWWVDFETTLENSLERESGERRDAAASSEGPEPGGESASAAADRNVWLKRLSREIQDFPRHLSIHPGGFLLGSLPIDHLVPVENAAMEGRTVIQWDKYDIEAMNLFKVDLLGLGALNHLDGTMRLLKEYADIEVTLKDISRAGDDPDVFAALGRGDTVGVFQVESRAQMAMLPRIKPRRFYDLVIEVSIVRPGPISGGMVHPYLRRRNGEEEVTYPHPSLEPVLAKTLGIPLFQEQVMKLAVTAADYTPGEADQLRRDMAAWRSSGKIARHREKLVSRMVEKGIEREFAEAVYKQIQGFGEYGFPESHAASFALIAYATAWFKVKYPAFFTCGLLNAWPMGFYSPATIVDDAKRHGIPILPIDVAVSGWECFPERSGADGRWGVRMGLRYVRGLSRRHGEAVSALRGRAIADVDEFAVLSRLDAGTMKTLALSGALDSLGSNRRSGLWKALGSRNDGKTELSGPPKPTAASFAAEGAAGLFGGLSMPDPVAFGDLDSMERISWDYAASMHSAHGHPLEPLRKHIEELGYPDSEDVRSRKDGSRCAYIGIVICRQRPGTANGVIFMTLEDESGFVNLVVWEKIYRRYRDLLLTRTLLGVRGRIQSKDGTVHLIVDECFEPPSNLASPGIDSRDFR